MSSLSQTESEFPLNTLTVWLESNMCYVSLLVITVNIFHILILRHKTMTSSAVTSLLLGIALVDILSPCYYLLWAIRNFIWERSCSPPRTTIESITSWLLLAIRADFRRCSTWFGLDLAVIRMVSMRLALKQRLRYINEAWFGRRVMFVTFCLSTSISVCYYFRFSNGMDSDALLSPGCNPIDDNGEEESGNQGHIREVHLILTSVFGKIVPSILFLIVGSVMIWELGKSAKMTRLTVSLSSERTSKLVIYMTITFIVIELPIGVCKLITATRDSYEEAITTESLKKLLNMAYIPLTATHCLICFSMSSQYRATARRMFGIKRRRSSSIQIVSTVQPTNSH